MHKTMIGNKRLRYTEKTYNGRIFVYLLAQSLIIYQRVCELHKDRVPKSEIDKVKDLDGNSIALLLTRLGHIKAKKLYEVRRLIFTRYHEDEKSPNWLTQTAYVFLARSLSP